MKRMSLGSSLLLAALMVVSLGGQRVVGSDTGAIRLFLPLLRRPAATLVFAERTSDNALDLFTIGADGGAKTRLTSTALDEWEPAWSPDRNRIAFSRWHSQAAEDGNLDFRHHIYIMNLDGTGERQLVSLLSSQGPAWSPDGAQLAFLGHLGVDYAGEPDAPYLFVVRANGSDLRQLTASSECYYAPQWSPDGRLIACGSSANILGLLVLNADGSQPRRLGSAFHTVRPGRFVWSPDSTRVVYAISDAVGPIALVVQRVDGSAPVELLRGREFYAAPHWSPDGSKIVFTTITATAAQLTAAIEVINADGTGRRRLLALEDTRIEDPLWSPDGQQISFAALDLKAGISYGVYVVNADGSAPLRLSDGMSQFWRP